MTTRTVSLLMGAGLVCLAFAFFVWPTPYEYEIDNTTPAGPVPVRRHRLTGKVDWNLDGKGWLPIDYYTLKAPDSGNTRRAGRRTQ